MRDVFKIQTPFFIPLYRRLIVLAVTAAWVAVEMSRGEPIWAFVAISATIYVGVQFFLQFDEEAIRAKADEADD